jgi:hypothetical protein
MPVGPAGHDSRQVQVGTVGIGAGRGRSVVATVTPEAGTAAEGEKVDATIRRDKFGDS